MGWGPGSGSRLSEDVRSTGLGATQLSWPFIAHTHAHTDRRTHKPLAGAKSYLGRVRADRSDLNALRFSSFTGKPLRAELGVAAEQSIKDMSEYISDSQMETQNFCLQDENLISEVEETGSNAQLQLRTSMNIY